jgi:hypothetical protein
MNTKDKYLELIEKYKDGGMTPAEEKEFLKRIGEEPELAVEFELRMRIEKEWRASGQYESVKKMVSRSVNEEIGVIRRNRLILRIAASFLVLATLGSLFYLFNPSTKDNGIMQNSKEMPAVASIDSTDTYSGPELALPSDNSVISINDSVLFRRHNAGIKSRINIISLPDNIIILSRDFQPGEMEFTIRPGFFKPGEYLWYIDSTNVTWHFKIKNGEQK